MRRWTGEDVWVFRNDVLDESRLDFAKRVGCSVRSVERWERGGPIGRQLSRALDEALRKAPQAARVEFEALCSKADTVGEANDRGSAETAKASGASNRRDTLELASAAMVASGVLVEAAAEIMELTRRAEASSLGSGTLAQVELVVVDLNQAYVRTPAAELFPVVR
jgi:hypothetical protein